MVGDDWEKVGVAAAAVHVPQQLTWLVGRQHNKRFKPATEVIAAPVNHQHRIVHEPLGVPAPT